MAHIAIVLGGAAAVWEELKLALEFAPDAMIVGTNHAARDYDGRVDHYVTMHPELLPSWLKARAAAGRPLPGQLWTADHRPAHGIEIARIKSVGGSSGLLATMVSLALGAERIMLCGVPMNQNGRHYDKPGMPWVEARQYLSAWDKQLPLLKGRVKSFGGDTMRLLGSPTKAWVDGG